MPNNRPTQIDTQPPSQPHSPRKSIPSSASGRKSGASPQIEWVKFSKAFTPVLHNWECAIPSSHNYDRYRGRHHPAEWELETQGYFRNMRYPLPAGEVAWLGFRRDTGGKRELAAACRFAFNESENVAFILTIAVASNFRRQGIGKEVLDYLCERVSNHRPEWPIATRIDSRNEASQALFRSCGFEYSRRDGFYEIWIRP